jgi:hypothetical protein
VAGSLNLKTWAGDQQKRRFLPSNKSPLALLAIANECSWLERMRLDNGSDELSAGRLFIHERPLGNSPSGSAAPPARMGTMRPINSDSTGLGW